MTNFVMAGVIRKVAHVTINHLDRIDSETDKLIKFSFH